MCAQTRLAYTGPMLTLTTELSLQITVKHAVFCACLTPQLESLTVGHRLLYARSGSNLTILSPLPTCLLPFYYKTHRTKVSLFSIVNVVFPYSAISLFYLLLLILKV